MPQCGVKTFGGAHELCDIAPEQPCFVYSFGISTEYSFDLDVGNRWGCYGFAADPTIDHPSKLPNITFHSIAAKMREQSAYPLVTSIPALRQWLGHSRVAVLKMDCEGCEYSLGEDIENEDPMLFDCRSAYEQEVVEFQGSPTCAWIVVIFELRTGRPCTSACKYWTLCLCRRLQAALRSWRIWAIFAALKRVATTTFSQRLQIHGSTASNK